MKYDIAMQLLANGVIKKEHYNFVSKMLKGVRLSKEELEKGIDEGGEGEYYFNGMVSRSPENSICYIKLLEGEQGLTIKYDVFNLRLEASENTLGQIKFQLGETITEDQSKGGRILGYYIVDKKADEDLAKVEYYDETAYIMAFDYSNKNNHDPMTSEAFKLAGLLPDREGTIESDDFTELVSKLIIPTNIGSGSFEEELEKVTKFNDEKTM